ncbi:family 10 glycosylhydrolase [Cellulosilyticum sp. WCF-2]|uniref:family 10 glycosylhydrolase n=1 Tax=Cellulosilyticum sp. WCF-2 TaxID=2497860 RepID=UPI000F8E1892|nr:family 10 glycosylhydrolase [Cellulosilyticum sp. WCF-2]QEH68735.1 family 10 glycosylhydrolase [Cellulosilyticum sp. WCF-2]
MKKVVSVFTVFMLIVSMFSVNALAQTQSKQLRGVWISTVYNLDYPSTKNNISAQKDEFTTKLDQLKAIGINAVFIQVRPKADALYKSHINPWSDVLTGTQGQDPGYDPLAFMIEEAHKRGMELHAWLNPYRVTTSGTDVNALAINHPARLNPSWLFSYNNALYYNPELEEVKVHIVDTVKEIATNYNVDGIHFDDYFYPSSYPLPAGESKDGTVANHRRQAVNDMVSRVSYAIKAINRSSGKNISFGISPAGIWKNNTSDPLGSATSGNEAYYSVYADARTWIQNGWLDYITPQIYWETGHAKADYETLVKWWSNQVVGTSTKLYIGQGIYRDVVATQIDTQLAVNEKYTQVEGSIYFSLRDLLSNRMGSKDKISNYYKANPVTGTGNTGSGGNSSNNGNSNTENGTGSGSSSSNVNPNAVGKTGVVSATTLNIRSGARTDRPVVAKVSSGTKVTILSILGDWYKVKLSNGTVGWASAAYIKVDASQSTTNNGNTAGSTTNTSSFPKQGTVNATSLNIRAGARTDRPIVAKLAKGTKVTILSVLGDWYKVKLADGTIGWCVKTYIS